MMLKQPSLHIGSTLLWRHMGVMVSQTTKNLVAGSNKKWNLGIKDPFWGGSPSDHLVHKWPIIWKVFSYTMESSYTVPIDRLWSEWLHMLHNWCRLQFRLSLNENKMESFRDAIRYNTEASCGDFIPYTCTFSFPENTRKNILSTDDTYIH